MKRMLAIMLSLICILSLAGCSKDLEVSKNSIYVDKEGTVVSFEIDKLEQSYYSVEELQQFINDNVETYNKSKGTEVVVDEVTEEEGKVKVKITYPSATDYARINNTVLFEGTATEAEAAGYNLNTNYFVNNKGQLNKDSYVPSEKEYVVIAEVGVDVIVDGKITAVSAIDSAVPHVGEKNDRAGYDETNLSSDSFIVVYKK